MDFWSGTVVLRHEGFERNVTMKAVLNDDFDLKFVSNSEFGIEALLLAQRDDLAIEVDGIQDPVRVFLSRTATSELGEEQTTFTPRSVPVWRGNSHALLRGRAALINFGGTDDEFGHFDQMQLQDEKWSLRVIPVQASILTYPPCLQTESYAVTHHLDFQRLNGETFSSEEMTEFLNRISSFFSFCQGDWVVTALSVGLCEKSMVVSEEWGVGRVAPRQDASGFLDRFHMNSLVELYPLFMKLMEDEDWAEVVGHIVYWLRRSSMENAGTDGGIILLQANLERIAWHLLVRTQGALSENGFGDLTAADQLRLMLSTLKIPKQVPDGLAELERFAKAHSIDAPEAFTRVRNKIVHPPKLRSRKDKYPFYDAYRLGRWYVELALLSACGYKGKYSDRTRRLQYAGVMDSVPWS